MTLFRPVALAAVLSLAWAVAGEAGIIRGVVLDAKTGKPVVGARAFAYIPGHSATALAQGISDSDGVFWLSDVPAGVLALRVQASWHDPWSGTVSMGGVSDTERVEARVSRQTVPGTLSGLITAEGGRKPALHAHVILRGAGLEATVDSTGQFTMFNTPVGPQTVEVVALGYDIVRMPIAIEEGRNNIVRADLGRSLAAGGHTKSTSASTPDTVGCVRFIVADTTDSRHRIGRLGDRHVTVDILSGERVVRKLMDWATAPGFYTVPWNGRDDAGKSVSKGTYRYRAKVDQETPIQGEFVKR